MLSGAHFDFCGSLYLQVIMDNISFTLILSFTTSPSMNFVNRISLVLVLFAATCYSKPVHAQPELEVERVVSQFLEAISKKDTTAYRQLMIPEGTAIALVEREGDFRYWWRQVDEDVLVLKETKETLLERMWEPEIRVDGILASVWDPV